MKAAVVASFVLHMAALAAAPTETPAASTSPAVAAPKDCDLEITADPEPEYPVIARGAKL